MQRFEKCLIAYKYKHKSRKIVKKCFLFDNKLSNLALRTSPANQKHKKIIFRKRRKKKHNPVKAY